MAFTGHYIVQGDDRNCWMGAEQWQAIALNSLLSDYVDARLDRTPTVSKLKFQHKGTAYQFVVGDSHLYKGPDQFAHSLLNEWNVIITMQNIPTGKLRYILSGRHPIPSHGGARRIAME